MRRQPLTVPCRRRQTLSLENLEERCLLSGNDHLLEAYGQVPLSFEANHGQTDSQVRFLSHGPGYALYLTGQEAVLSLNRAKDASAAVLRMQLLGSNARPGVTGVNLLPGKVNYLQGNDPSRWRTHVPTYGKVDYQEVYPGIDLVYYGNQRQLEYDFIVAPGVDPSAIRLRFAGADRLEIDGQGNLLLHTLGGVVQQQRPISYQEWNGQRREVASAYVLSGNQVHFQVGAYDASRPLTIDPVIVYSTYLGASMQDEGYAIDVDYYGSAYVTGRTSSPGFPVVPGSVDLTYNGPGFDVFVTKLDPTGSFLIYSTFLGGHMTDEGYGIAVDCWGLAHVTGRTNSTDFPVVPWAFDLTFNGGPWDAFVTVLDSAGASLWASTYLGGRLADEGYAIDTQFDPSCQRYPTTYVTGRTNSIDYPVTPGAFDPTYNGGPFDAFVTHLDLFGSVLFYSTFLGGQNDDQGFGIAVDCPGTAHVTGRTNSTNFPVTPGAFDTTFNGGPYDAFVTRLVPSGAALIYSTFLGGRFQDEGFGISIDYDWYCQGFVSAAITGRTNGPDYPVVPWAFDPTFNGGVFDAFITRLDPSGSVLWLSSYLGGHMQDEGYAIHVDLYGNPHVTGRTNSAVDFPLVAPWQPLYGGGLFDAFVSKTDYIGSILLYSSFHGGRLEDSGQGIATDFACSAYVTGYTNSVPFPVTAGSWDTTYNGGLYDAFVTKIAEPCVGPGPAPGGGAPRLEQGPTSAADAVTALLNSAAGRFRGALVEAAYGAACSPPEPHAAGTKVVVVADELRPVYRAEPARESAREDLFAVMEWDSLLGVAF